MDRRRRGFNSRYWFVAMFATLGAFLGGSLFSILGLFITKINDQKAQAAVTGFITGSGLGFVGFTFLGIAIARKARIGQPLSKPLAQSEEHCMRRAESAPDKAIASGGPSNTTSSDLVKLLAELNLVGWLLLVVTVGLWVLLIVVVPLPEAGALHGRVPRTPLNTLVITLETLAAIFFFVVAERLLAALVCRYPVKGEASARNCPAAG